MSNSIAPGSSADVNVRVTALTTNPNVPVTYKTIILKKNLVNEVNTLTQEMMFAQNTKYVIKYDYTLGEDITVPANCVLSFNGGSISGEYTITGNNTGIKAGLVKIFNTYVTLAGSWNISEAYPEWYGAKGDGVTDDRLCIQKTLRLNTTIVLSNKIYAIYSPIYLYQSTVIKGAHTNFTLFSNLHPSDYDDKTENPEGSIIAMASMECVLFLMGSNIRIDGIGINANHNANIAIEQPDRTKNFSYITLENVFIRNVKSHGIVASIYMSQFHNVRVDNIDSSTGIGIYIASTTAELTSLDFYNVYVLNAQRAENDQKLGIYLYKCNYSNIRDCGVDHCGIGYVLEGCKSTSILNSGNEDCLEGVSLRQNCTGVLVDGLFSNPAIDGFIPVTANKMKGDATVANVSILGKYAESISGLIVNQTPYENINYVKGIFYIDHTVNKFACSNVIVVERNRNLIEQIAVSQLIDIDHDTIDITQVCNTYRINSFDSSYDNYINVFSITLSAGNYAIGLWRKDVKKENAAIQGRLGTDINYGGTLILELQYCEKSFTLDSQTTLYFSIKINKNQNVNNILLLPYIFRI